MYYYASKLYAEIIALCTATSVFDQKNLSEYKSHLIIGYF